MYVAPRFYYIPEKNLATSNCLNFPLCCTKHKFCKYDTVQMQIDTKERTNKKWS